MPRHVHSAHGTKLINTAHEIMYSIIYKKYTEIIGLKNIHLDSILGIQVICVGFQLVLDSRPLSTVGKILQVNFKCFFLRV